MRAPLIEALTTRHGVPLLRESDLEGFLCADRHSLLFLAGDADKYPEAFDVAVILPELIGAFAGRFQTAVIASESEQALQARFGFSRWPALVLLRGQDYVGAITRVRNWDEYQLELARLLECEPGRPPGVGIPVTAEGRAEGAAEQRQGGHG
jgi:hydrogenase-1 operon protein HyaE